MKASCFLMAIFLASAVGAPAFYDDLILADGSVKTNVFITRVEPDGLSFMHETGVTKLYFPELAEPVQQKYNYDPAIAAVYWYYTQQVQKEWDLRQLQAAQTEAETRAQRLVEIEEEDTLLRAKAAAKNTHVKLVRMEQDGLWLCRTFSLEKGGFTRGRAQYKKVFSESQILVEGLPDNMVDNDEWRGRIYEAGIYQIKSEGSNIRTLRKYKTVR